MQDDAKSEMSVKLGTILAYTNAACNAHAETTVVIFHSQIWRRKWTPQLARDRCFKHTISSLAHMSRHVCMAAGYGPNFSNNRLLYDLFCSIDLCLEALCAPERNSLTLHTFGYRTVSNAY